MFPGPKERQLWLHPSSVFVLSSGDSSSGFVGFFPFCLGVSGSLLDCCFLAVGGGSVFFFCFSLFLGVYASCFEGCSVFLT